MESMDYRREYERWMARVRDSELLDELMGMTDAQREDAFYRELAFGTGGLRGVIGAGTNRMNIHVVARASQGLSDYLLEAGDGAEKRVVIGYDSRIKSETFARAATGVFAANGIKVYFWSLHQHFYMVLRQCCVQ